MELRKGEGMKISDKRAQQAYAAVADQVMSLRIKSKKGEVEDMDIELFMLEIKIWTELKAALNIEVNHEK